MHTVYKNVDKIIPYEKPPRINNAAFEAVANSVSGFVFRQPTAVAAITWSRDSARCSASCQISRQDYCRNM